MTPFKTLFLSQLKSLSKCISHALMPFWIFCCCAELCSNNTLIVFPNVCLTSFASKHDHLLQIIGPPNRNANIFYVNQNCSNSYSNDLIWSFFLPLRWNFLYVASTFCRFSNFVLICIFATNLMGLDPQVIRSYPQGTLFKNKLKFREFKS